MRQPKTTGNATPGRMVYRQSMIAVLTSLLLGAAAPGSGAAEGPAPLPAGTAVAESPTPTPAAPGVTESPTPDLLTPILSKDARMEAYDLFRGFYETSRFAEALPYARRVVELSETDPERDFELPIAYNNLGATQYQLGDYQAAAESYRNSLEMLESTQGISSRRLVVPLSGLGAAYAALDQHALAAELLDRALAVSRRADGLFNLTQLPLIEQAADSRFAIEDFVGVERQRLYALKIAEQNYGFGDERTLPRNPPTCVLLRIASRVRRGANDVPARAGCRLPGKRRIQSARNQESIGHRPHPSSPVHDESGHARRPAAGARRGHG